MRIGIDAHIVLKEHKRYDPKIARYTEQLVAHLLEAEGAEEHTWVLFFDSRMQGSRKLKKFERENVEIHHFPFIHYRRYLPVVYSHMLISSFLGAAKLDVFHSPEGLIPYLYRGRIVTTFHYVPRGKTESNLFVRTFMFGARGAFARLCKRAYRIIVNSPQDRRRLMTDHQCGGAQVVVMEEDDLERVDWSKRTQELLTLYKRVGREDRAAARKKARVKKKKARAEKKAARKETKKSGKPKRSQGGRRKR